MSTLLASLAGCENEPAPPSPAADAAERDHSARRVDVRLDGQGRTSLHYGDEWDKPFLHPLSTPSGVTVTRGFPLAPLPGESQDHAWHRGVIWGHGLINGHDFWREQGRDKTARLRPAAPPSGRIEGETAIVEAVTEMLPPSGPPIGTCRQIYRLEQTADGLLIDAAITVQADRDQSLTFGDTEDGGFGFRFDDVFRQDRGAKLLNSDGLIGSENIWGKRARWVQYSTSISSKPASVTIFDHPSNFRHPTYWHARDYGLCAANPFGLHDFLGDPAQDGSHTVDADGEMLFRYRVLIADGVTPEPDIERIFTAWT